jgi:hypothetical protein
MAAYEKENPKENRKTYESDVKYCGMQAPC